MISAQKQLSLGLFKIIHRRDALEIHLGYSGVSVGETLRLEEKFHSKSDI